MDFRDIRNRLINAIRNGELETTRELINSHGLPYSESSSKGYDLLCEALENNYSEIAKLLLTSGSEVNSYQDSSNTPLHSAVRNGDIEIIKMLLVRGANINAQNIYGQTPLHETIDNDDQVEIIELLLKHKANINVEDNGRKTPLFFAIKNENLQISKLLLDNGAKVTDYPEIMNMALIWKCTEIVELLLQHNANVNATDENGYTALLVSVSGCYDASYTKIIKLLLNHGANVDAKTPDGETPLAMAISNQSSQVVEVLLEFNANVNFRNQINRETPLHMSARSRDVEICKMLLNKGADVDAKEENGFTALHIASNEGHNEVITTLLEYGCDVNSRDKDGKTALHIASQFGHNEVVTTLLEYGSDFNIMTYNDLTPLDCAKTVETIEILRRHIVQMKTANLYVNQQNLLSVDEISFPDFQEKCENEITSLKSVKMNNYNISFYDILIRNTHSLAICLRNENIVQILKLDDYKTKFPIYGSMMNIRFRNGMKRKELLDQVNKILHFLYSFFANHRQLPQECVENIISYLSDEDLKIIIKKSKDK